MRSLEISWRRSRQQLSSRPRNIGDTAGGLSPVPLKSTNLAGMAPVKENTAIHNVQAARAIPMVDPMMDHLTIRQAADRLRLDSRTVQRWADKGKIEHIRLGRKIWFPPDSIRDALGTLAACLPIHGEGQHDAPGFVLQTDGIPMEDYLAEQLTLPEAVVILRHVRTTVQKWVKEGKLKCLTVGRNQYFEPDEIRRFIEAGRRRKGFLEVDRRRGLPI